MGRTRIEEEKDTVEMMIRLYCKHHEGNPHLCDNCRALLDYARERLTRCPFGNSKSTCRKCTVHCYKPEMRQKMKEVMRYSGPRMMLYHPLEAVKHIIREAMPAKQVTKKH